MTKQHILNVLRQICENLQANQTVSAYITARDLMRQINAKSVEDDWFLLEEAVRPDTLYGFFNFWPDNNSLGNVIYETLRDADLGPRKRITYIIEVAPHTKIASVRQVPVDVKHVE